MQQEFTSSDTVFTPFNINNPPIYQNISKTVSKSTPEVMVDIHSIKRF